MAGILLKVGKEMYLTKITALTANMSMLESIKTRYQSLLNSLSSEVMEETDSNFTSMEEQVQNNIAAVENALTVLTNAKDELQQVVSGMEDIESNVSSTLQNTIDAAKDSLSAAKTAFDLFG